MNSKKVFFGMIALLILVAGAAGGVLVFGDITLSKQANKLMELKLENRLLDEQQTALVQANKDIKQYEDLEQTAKTVVPQDKDQARAVREIISIAAESGIKISSVTFPTSSLGTKSPTGSGGGTATPGEESAPSSSTPTSSPISQAKPVEGISGVYSLEMSIVPDGEKSVNYYDFLTFLRRLENNRRTAQVTSVKITPLDENQATSDITFSLTINIFVKP